MTEADQLDAALSDKLWRLENLYLILDENGETRPLVLREEQKQFLRDRHSRNFVPKARKLGMSTIIVIDYLDECLWNDNTHCAHVDFRGDDAKKKLEIAKFSWSNGPSHPDPFIAAIWMALHRDNPMTEDSKSRLAWKNGSKQEADTSFMGGTPKRLHISEFGPMAAQAPERARKVKRGSFNAVGAGGIIDIETTHEGGKFGECWAIFKLALDKAGSDDLSRLDWKLHFFPWFNHPSYILPGRNPQREETVKYFAELKKDEGLDIPPARQAWYEATYQTQREDMFSQYPSTPEECTKISVYGAIYPQIITLRTKGRVCEFEAEPRVPLITGWDIGVSDYLSGWAVQFAGRDILWHCWAEFEGAGAERVVQTVREWEQLLGVKAAMNLLPHDADYREKGSAKTYVDILKDCGMHANTIRVVPRTPDIWIGINAVRNLLPRSWFHKRTDVEIKDEDGVPIPSGLGCLENYRKAPPTSSGTLRPAPVHDQTSHTADAARTIGEAYERKIIQSIINMPEERGEVKVSTGYGGSNRAQKPLVVRR